MFCLCFLLKNFPSLLWPPTLMSLLSFSSLFLLNYNLYITVFQVYDIMIWHWYSFLSKCNWHIIYSHSKLTNLITWTTALSNSKKLWAMPCRATQDRWVMLESSDKMWSSGEGNGKLLECCCFENPMNGLKRQKDRTLKDELHRLVGAHCATEISGEITPERVKRRSQSKNIHQLWMWLVIKARSKAVKSNIA